MFLITIKMSCVISTNLFSNTSKSQLEAKVKQRIDDLKTSI